MLGILGEILKLLTRQSRSWKLTIVNNKEIIIETGKDCKNIVETFYSGPCNQECLSRIYHRLQSS